MTIDNAKFKELLRQSGSPDRDVAYEAQRVIALAAGDIVRESVRDGDVTGGIMQPIMLDPREQPEFELDPIAPGSENQHVAYTLPNQGYIPQNEIVGDYVTLPTYRVGYGIDWTLRYAAHSRIDLFENSMQTSQESFVKKLNDDVWHLILTAIADRNIMIYDADATAGFLSKRLLSAFKTAMVRNGGGNAGSLRRFKATDIYVSPEGLEDMRNWGVDQVDEITRRDIMIAADGSLPRIFELNLHEMVEFGEGQEYQNYFTGTLGASLDTSDVELVVALDLSPANRKSFVMPVREELVLHPDPMLLRSQKAGLFGWMEFGLGCLDNRNVLGGSF